MKKADQKVFCTMYLKVILFVFLALILWSVLFGTTLAATISLSPQEETVSEGDTFTVEILLHTENVEIEGIDINKLHFSPEVFSVVDADPDTEGVQINAGSLMSATPVNSVDNANGTITFSQVESGGGTYANTAGYSVAQFTLKAKNEGSASFSFDFTKGDTVDTNVASNGADILDAVSGATYTVNNESADTTDSDNDEDAGSGSGTSSGGSDGSGSGGGSGSDTTDDTDGSGDTTSSGGGGYTPPTFTSPSSGDDAESEDEGSSTDTSLSNDESSQQDEEKDQQQGEQTSPTLSVEDQRTPSFSKEVTGPLAVGMNNERVRTLQEALSQFSDIYPEGLTTGYYGPLTRRAVERFQERHDIVSSGSPSTTGYGLAGPKTRSKLNEVLSANEADDGGSSAAGASSSPESGSQVDEVLSRDLSFGDRGEDVKRLQKYLNRNGFILAEDGPGSPGQETTYFGPRTREAVKWLQNARATEILEPVGLSAGEATGYFGPSTRAYIRTAD